LKLHWKNKNSVVPDILDEQLHVFMFHTGSLTNLIEECCNDDFNIELLTESWRSPFPDEIDSLSIKNGELAFIRESRLKSGNQTLVYARTVIPRETLTIENQKLTQLGANPLGNVLFNDDSASRTNMRYAKIPVNCELHEQATKNTRIQSELWARQSLFHINNKPLMITEVFLPAILECSKN
jgi:chorismate lyase